MPEFPFPSHASPHFSPQPVRPNHAITRHRHHETSAPAPSASTESSAEGGSHDEASRRSNRSNTDDDVASTPGLPDSIVSPSFTPPSTPSKLVPPQPTTQTSELRDRLASKKPPKLLSRLPNVECIVRARIPTTSGAEMFLHLFQNDIDNKEHLAIVFGNKIRSRGLDREREGETEMDRMVRGAYVGRLRPGRVSSRYDETERSQPAQNGEDNTSTQSPLVRIHSECYTGETAWSARCDCGEQLDEAARLMSQLPESSPDSPGSGGVIIYLRQEGRGIGLGEKLKAYNLQDLGSDTVEANLLLRHPADARSYGLATAMLADLGLGVDSSNDGIRLLTNNPDKVRAVEGPNREVVVQERVPMVPIAWRTGGAKGIRSSEIEGYLKTKVGVPAKILLPRLHQTNIV